jgi:hypothetical protein
MLENGGRFFKGRRCYGPVVEKSMRAVSRSCGQAVSVDGDGFSVQEFGAGDEKQ